MIVFVDCETLGLDPDRHAIWEVGAIRYDEQKREVIDEVVWQLTLTNSELSQAEPIALDIGRFEERRRPVAAQFDPAVFAAVFQNLAAEAHLAGAVVSFDEERLRRLLLRHNVKPSWHYHLIDVEALTVGFLNGLRRAGTESQDTRTRNTARSLPWKSDDLSVALGVKISEDDRHTALGDARWALDMYKAVME